MELCEQLDAIYRERYRIETDPVVKKEIEDKAWANYNLYMSLVEPTPQFITQPQLRLLQEKTNNS